MARVPRKLKVLPGFSVHKVWRGHNREWNLETNEQKEQYLEFMNEDLESEKYKQGSQPQALTLMSNHTHEVSGVNNPELYSNHMRRHHSRYGSYFNRLKERCGKVAQDRPHTTLIADDFHEMQTVFYIHANPIRAKIVSDAKDYAYSTHKLYAFGKSERWMRNIRFPRWYMNLGKDMPSRQKKYRRLFARYLKAKGLVKQNFLRKLFIGPATWMREKEQAVAAWRQAIREGP